MTFFTRLLLLYVAVIGFTAGVYWSAHQDIDQGLSDAWTYVDTTVRHLDYLVAYQATGVWLVTVGRRFWLEALKRLFILFGLPYLIIWLLPVQWYRWIRRTTSRTKKSFVENHSRFMYWLRTHMFGPHTGHALGLIAAAGFILLSYFAFWAYLMLWFSFVKIPSFIAGVLGFIGRHLILVAENMPFKTLVFNYGAKASEWLDTKITFVRWTLTMEEKRVRAKKMARKAILLRYRREHLIENITLSTYRRLLRKKRSETTTTPESSENDHGKTKERHDE